MTKYDHISVVSDSAEATAISTDVAQAVAQMRAQDFQQSGDTLKNLLLTVRNQLWVGREPQQVLLTEDGRSIAAPPTPLLVKLLVAHPDLIPFLIDHYLISGSEGGTQDLLITEQSRDRSDKIKAEKMDRLLTDLGYSPTGLTDSEKQIALAHQHDSLKSELLEALFVYSRQAISFDQTERTRQSLSSLLG